MKKFLLAAFTALSFFAVSNAQTFTNTVDGFTIKATVSDITSSSAKLSYEITPPETATESYTLSNARIWEITGSGLSDIKVSAGEITGTVDITGLQPKREYKFFSEWVLNPYKVVTLMDANCVVFTTTEGSGEDPKPQEATFSFEATSTVNETSVVFDYTIFKTENGVKAEATEADGPFKVYYAWNGNDKAQEAKAQTNPKGSFTCEGLTPGTGYAFYPKYFVGTKQLDWAVVNLTTTGTAPAVDAEKEITQDGYTLKATITEITANSAKATMTVTVANPEDGATYTLGELTRIWFVEGGAHSDNEIRMPAGGLTTSTVITGLAANTTYKYFWCAQVNKNGKDPVYIYIQDSDAFTFKTLAGSGEDPKPETKTKPTVAYGNTYKFEAVAGAEDQAKLTFNYTVTNPDNVEITSIRFAAAGAAGDAVAGVTYDKWSNGDIIWGEVTITDAAALTAGEHAAEIIVKNLNKNRDNNCWMKSLTTLASVDNVTDKTNPYETGGAGAWPVNPASLQPQTGVAYTFEATPTIHDNEVIFNYVIKKTVDGVAVDITDADGPFKVYYAWSGNDEEQARKASTTSSGSFTCSGLTAGTEYVFYPKYFVKEKQQIDGPALHITTSGTKPDQPDPEDPEDAYVNKLETNIRAAVIKDGKIEWTYAIEPPAGAEGSYGHTSGDWYFITAGATNYFLPGFPLTIGNTIDGRVKGAVDFTEYKDKLPEGFVMWTRINGEDYQLHFKDVDGKYLGEFITTYKYRQGRHVSYNFHIAYAGASVWSIMFTYEIKNADNAEAAKAFSDFVQYDPENGTANQKLDKFETAGVTEHKDEPIGDWELIARPADDLDAKPWNPTHDYLISNPVSGTAEDEVPVTVTFELENGTKIPADYEPKLIIYQLDENDNPVLDNEGHRVKLYGPVKMKRVPEVVNMFTLSTATLKSSAKAAAGRAADDYTGTLFKDGQHIGIQFNHAYTSIRPGKGNSNTALAVFTVNTQTHNVTGIEDVTVEEPVEESAVEYYTLQGVRVSADNLSTGIYIRRAGNKTSKIYVR